MTWAGVMVGGVMVVVWLGRKRGVGGWDIDGGRFRLILGGRFNWLVRFDRCKTL